MGIKCSNQYMEYNVIQQLAELRKLYQNKRVSEHVRGQVRDMKGQWDWALKSKNSYYFGFEALAVFLPFCLEV